MSGILSMALAPAGLGFRVRGLVFRIWDLEIGLWVPGLGVRLQGLVSSFRVWG